MAYWHLNQLQAHKLKTLSLTAGYIGQYLAGKFDEAGRWQISRERIREETGRSHSSIKRGLSELEEAGVIVSYRKGKRSAAEYFHALSCPPECEEKSHRSNTTKAQTPLLESTESPARESTESPVSEATNTPVNKPIKKERDLQVGLPLLKSLLEPLLSVENPRAHYVALSKAIEESPEEVEQLLVTSLERAHTSPHNYLDALLTNNPWKLVPRKSRAQRKAERIEKNYLQVKEHIDRSRGSDSREAGVSEANKSWLGDRGSYSPTRLRYAQVASELGIEIPLGLDTLSAGHLVAAAKEEAERGKPLESERWQSKLESSAQVTIS